MFCFISYNRRRMLGSGYIKRSKKTVKNCALSISMQEVFVKLKGSQDFLKTKTQSDLFFSKKDIVELKQNRDKTKTRLVEKGKELKFVQKLIKRTFIKYALLKEKHRLYKARMRLVKL